MDWLDHTAENPNLLERIGRIRRKLRAAQENWRNKPPAGRTPFGAAVHQYLLRPPLDEATVGAFETHHCIRLPAGYRAMIRHVGDGGAGPYYGLLPLARWDWCASGEAPAYPIPRRGYLSSLSPLNPFRPLDQSWQETLVPSEWDAYQGSIAIADHGGNRCTRLIVSGAARGRIVNADGYDDPPCFTEDAGFLSWYERWLDDTLAGNIAAWGRPKLAECV